jgi:hypothetical protein
MKTFVEICGDKRRSELMTREVANSVLERCEQIRALSDCLTLLLEGAVDGGKYAGSIDFLSQEINKEVDQIEDELRAWHNE